MRAFTLRPKKHAEVRQAFPRPGQEELVATQYQLVDQLNIN